jgi:hypothetical protein
MQNRHPSPSIHGWFKTIVEDGSQGQRSNGRDIAAWYVLSSWAALLLAGCGALRTYLTPNVDSPHTIVPERTAMRMPGSFGDDDGDEEVVDKLILGIGKLCVKDD